MSRRADLYRFEWDGILLEVRYVPVWLPASIYGEDVAHLEVRSVYPTAAPLPITETGYRSHFLAASIVTAAGGPIPYLDIWLTEASQTPEWRALQDAARQLPLF